MTVKKKLQLLGFKKLSCAPCAFIVGSKKVYKILCLYVDDMVLGTSNSEMVLRKRNENIEKI